MGRAGWSVIGLSVGCLPASPEGTTAKLSGLPCRCQSDSLEGHDIPLHLMTVAGYRRLGYRIVTFIREVDIVGC